ncbi:MAG: site-specific DNA-methyltransferase [Planctomycetota bacterium]
MTTGKIAVGDCLKSMSKWPDDCLDLVFADPPYNIGFKYDRYDDNRSGDDYVQWTQDWISQCARLLRPTGSMFVLIGDEYAAETRLHLKTLEKDGQLAFRNWIVWHYTFGQNCKAKFNRSHAHLFYCVGSAALGKWKATDPPFAFNREAIAVPSARQTTYRDARANPKGKLPDDTWYLRPQDVEAEGVERYFRGEEDTWYLSRVCGTFKERLGWHPCQLPEAMLERIVKLASNEGDLVFDPFAGSGTTLAVAARLGRRWLGCELSKDYAKKATARIKHVAKTGASVETTFADKGIVKGKPRKKAEPVRSPHLKGRRSKSA